jgi:pimeloyl-ACP methyl ester carboxylesterase
VLIRSEITIQCGDALLAGEWLCPDGDRVHPTVLMIHGSGPLDRNENTKRQSLDVFNALSDQLVASGIASFRYDKRGCGKSGGDYYSAGHADLVDDAQACLDYLSTVEGCDPAKIFVLGHSEGTIIAAQLATRCPQLAGLLLLCPFVEPMESILRRQSRQINSDLRQATGLQRILYSCCFALFGDPVSSQEKLLARIKASDAPTFRMMVQKVNAKWLRELIALDNQEVYSRVTTPMLLIAGEKDIQCLPGDVQRIADVAPAEVAQRVIPNLNHILRLDEDEPGFLSYGKLLKQPIDPSIGQLVSAWIAEH